MLKNYRNLPSIADLPEGITKGELAKQVYPHTTFDTALPQGWVDGCQELGFDPRTKFVWLYPEGSVVGYPAPLYLEAAQDLPKEMRRGNPAFEVTNAGYVLGRGTRCPVCRSENIEGGSVEVDAGAATQEVYCVDCGSEWEDVYSLIGYQNLGVGE